ncbi:MAG: hypothetical protein ABIO68_04360 [Sphingomicrobium sp.]
MNIDQVILTPLQGSGPSPWRVTFKNHSGDKPGDYPKVGAMQDSGPHLIVFDIVGGQPGVTFSKTDPIWVNPGSKPSSGAKDPQVFGKVSNDGQQLFVVNTNDKAGELHYGINFVGHKPLDPIIDNGGHGFYWGTSQLLIGAAVLLTIGFFLRPLCRAIFGR